MSISEMRECCIVPQYILDQLSTKKLFDLMLDYPLINDAILLFGDNPQGINILINTRNGVSTGSTKNDYLQSTFCDSKFGYNGVYRTTLKDAYDAYFGTDYWVYKEL